MSESRVAFFKVMPSSNIPHRKGPLQIIRCCQNCTREVRNPLEDGLDELLNFMCYDDLIIRKSMWFSPFQSIQYHMGQFELLTAALQDNIKETIFLVSQTNPADIEYLSTALRHSISDDIRLDVLKPGFRLSQSRSEPLHFKTVPLLYATCPSDSVTKGALLGPSMLDSLLKPIIEIAENDKNFDLQIVVVAITKDHDEKPFLGIGTVCIQMLEPFSMQDYIKNSLTSYQSIHMTSHIYYNVAQSVALLAPNLVAFLVLYLERTNGVSFEDLVNYVEWFRNVSIDINLQLGFTGETKDVIEFGLTILGNGIYKSNGCYLPKNTKKLCDYAHPVKVSIAYQGVIARAILVEHNKSSLSLDTIFVPERLVRVVRDDVIKTSVSIANELEWILSCRKPCVEVETMINQELSKMQLSGRYLSIQEPKIGTKPMRTYWAGEEDSDEEYFAMNKDKDAFKTWLQVTTKERRLDQLNLFINAIHCITPL